MKTFNHLLVLLAVLAVVSTTFATSANAATSPMGMTCARVSQVDIGRDGVYPFRYDDEDPALDHDLSYGATFSNWKVADGKLMGVTLSFVDDFGTGLELAVYGFESDAHPIEDWETIRNTSQELVFSGETSIADIRDLVACQRDFLPKLESPPSGPPWWLWLILFVITAFLLGVRRHYVRKLARKHAWEQREAEWTRRARAK
jgi:hypothetical protein